MLIAAILILMKYMTFIPLLVESFKYSASPSEGSEICCYEMPDRMQSPSFSFMLFFPLTAKLAQVIEKAVLYIFEFWSQARLEYFTAKDLLANLHAQFNQKEYQHKHGSLYSWQHPSLLPV